MNLRGNGGFWKGKDFDGFRGIVCVCKTQPVALQRLQSVLDKISMWYYGPPRALKRNSKCECHHAKTSSTTRVSPASDGIAFWSHRTTCGLQYTRWVLDSTRVTCRVTRHLRAGSSFGARNPSLYSGQAFVQKLQLISRQVSLRDDLSVS